MQCRGRVLRSSCVGASSGMPLVATLCFERQWSHLWSSWSLHEVLATAAIHLHCEAVHLTSFDYLRFAPSEGTRSNVVQIR